MNSTFNWYRLVDGLMEARYTEKLINTPAAKIEGLKGFGRIFLREPGL